MKAEAGFDAACTSMGRSMTAALLAGRGTRAARHPAPSETRGALPSLAQQPTGQAARKSARHAAADHRLALIEHLVADLLRQLLFQPAAAEVELAAVAGAQDAARATLVAAVGAGRAARELAHQRALHRRRRAAAQVVVLDAELDQAGDVAHAARGHRLSRERTAEVAERQAVAAAASSAPLLQQQIAELRVGRASEQRGGEDSHGGDAADACWHGRAPGGMAAMPDYRPAAPPLKRRARRDNAPMRLLHTMLRVGDLERAIDFYTRVLGMQLLRRSENPAYKYSLAFVGYDGGNPGQAEIELTYNWGTEQYEMGTAYGHIALGVPDVHAACDKIRAAGGQVTREPGPVKGGSTVIAFVTDPDGYKIELIERG